MADTVAIAFISSVAVGSTDQQSFTTSSISTTGASLIVVSLAHLGGSPTISDNQSNTYTSILATAGNAPYSSMWYAVAPTTSGSHTFTVTGTGNFDPSLFVAAFSGTATSTPLDQQNMNEYGSYSATVQPGSITPGEANELVVTMAGIPVESGTATIDGSYIIMDQVLSFGGHHFGGAHGYIVQTAATATNPTWGGGGMSYTSAAIASFKAAVEEQPPLALVVHFPRKNIRPAMFKPGNAR